MIILVGVYVTFFFTQNAQCGMPDQNKITNTILILKFSLREAQLFFTARLEIGSAIKLCWTGVALTLQCTFRI